MTDQWLTTITSLILDMDGVLWRENEAIGDLQAIFNQISVLGLKVIFATNNCTRTVEQYVKHLASFGINANPDQVITSATAAVSILKDLYPSGGPVYIIGEQGLIDACDEAGFYLSDNESKAVVVGLDRSFSYQKLQCASLLLRKGVPFIGTNPDPSFPTPLGLIPGAGAILSALSTASGITPIIAGKPEPLMYQVALHRLNEAADVVLAVGDRPETDISGAQQIGCRTALMLSGVTSRQQALTWKPAPDLILQDLSALVDLISLVKQT